MAFWRLGVRSPSAPLGYAGKVLPGACKFSKLEERVRFSLPALMMKRCLIFLIEVVELPLLWMLAITVGMITNRRYRPEEIAGVLYHRAETEKWMKSKFQNRQPIGSQRSQSFES